MGVKKSTSFISEERVNKHVENTYETFKGVTGRNPNERERANLKKKIIDVAKRLDSGGEG